MTIKNTSAEPDPGWVGGRNPRAIANQEREGQKQLAEDSALPRKGLHDLLRDSVFAGIIVGDPRPGDPLFINVTLPAGWAIKPTSHDMWSDLVDETGVKRAEIFYKAAYYDRDAFISKA